MKNPLVSIIIPTFNRAHLIGETLDSVLVQTYANWECIIVDDGSTDSTYEVLDEYCKKDKRFQYHQRPSDRLKGGNAARNYGFELSKGELIQWFDSDDLMYDNLLELQINNIYNKSKSFSICLYDRFDEDFSKLTKKGIPINLNNGLYYDYVIRGIEANLQTILFKKKMLLGFQLSETLHKSQEYEFLQRIFKNFELECAILNKVLIKVRRHKNSITETIDEKKIDSALKAILVTFGELPKNVPQKIKNRVIKNYLKTLYVSFSNKMQNVFYTYLLKIIYLDLLRGLLAIFILGLLYPITHILNIGTWHYKRIYKLLGL